MVSPRQARRARQDPPCHPAWGPPAPPPAPSRARPRQPGCRSRCALSYQGFPRGSCPVAGLSPGERNLSCVPSAGWGVAWGGGNQPLLPRRWRPLPSRPCPRWRWEKGGWDRAPCRFGVQDPCCHIWGSPEESGVFLFRLSGLECFFILRPLPSRKCFPLKRWQMNLFPLC